MKRKMRANEYNKRLLTVLVAITVFVCVIFAVVAIRLSNKGDSVSENKPYANVSAEENNGSDEAKVPENGGENLVTEKEPEVQDEPEQPEITQEAAEWNLILANPWNKLPEDFTVELEDIGSGHRVDKRIVEDLNNMMADLCRDGRSAFICSSYRTNTKQTTLYNNEVNDYLSRGYSEEDAAVEAGKWVAVPGTSEHQTGLAVDIMSSYYLVLDRGQEDTAEQKWLMENSYKYGFILRYPNDKSELTGIYYEPWHYRYVGKTVAKEIFEKGICFEEYLAN